MKMWLATSRHTALLTSNQRYVAVMLFYVEYQNRSYDVLTDDVSIVISEEGEQKPTRVSTKCIMSGPLTMDYI